MEVDRSRLRGREGGREEGRSIDMAQGVRRMMVEWGGKRRRVSLRRATVKGKACRSV